MDYKWLVHRYSRSFHLQSVLPLFSWWLSVLSTYRSISFMIVNISGFIAIRFWLYSMCKNTPYFGNSWIWRTFFNNEYTRIIDSSWIVRFQWNGIKRNSRNVICIMKASYSAEKNRNRKYLRDIVKRWIIRKERLMIMKRAFWIPRDPSSSKWKLVSLQQLFQLQWWIDCNVYVNNVILVQLQMILVFIAFESVVTIVLLYASIVFLFKKLGC